MQQCDEAEFVVAIACVVDSRFVKNNNNKSDRNQIPQADQHERVTRARGRIGLTRDSTNPSVQTEYVRNEWNGSHFGALLRLGQPIFHQDHFFTAALYSAFQPRNIVLDFDATAGSGCLRNGFRDFAMSVLVRVLTSI